MQEVQENQSTFINCCWSGSRGGGKEWERGPINCTGSWARACLSAATLTHSVHSKSKKKWEEKKEKKGNERDHHNGGVPARTGPALRTWKDRRAWKETLYFWCGWRAVCGGLEWVEDCIWRSMKILSFNMSHMWEGLTAIEEVLKAAAKVAAGEKHPALHFTTNRHLFVNIQMLQRSWRAISCNSATNGSSYML